MNQVKERFKKNLKKFTLYADANKGPYFYGLKETAVKEGKFLHLPRHKRRYIVLDLDYNLSGGEWMGLGLPEPTILIINPLNGHSKYMYELWDPVQFPADNGKIGIKISWKAIEFFEGVKRGLDHVLDGDVGYSGPAVNNPLHPHWRVYWADHRYTLHDLAEYAAYVPKKFQREFDGIIEGREKYLFHTVRLWAYPEVAKFKNYEDYYLHVLNKANEVYEEKIRNWEKDHPFYYSEVKSVAISISKWVWAMKDYPRFKRYLWNVGAMNLPLFDKTNKSKEEIIMEQNRRKSLGGNYSSMIQREKTAQKIRFAVDSLKLQRKALTKANISRVSGLHKSTLNKYKDFIYNYINNI